LLAWPDHPYALALCTALNSTPETKCRESFVIAETVDLDRNETYAKERALIDEVKAQFARGRKCQVFAVYTAAALLGGAGRGGSGGQGN
jgi:hypothetical protein